MSRINVVVASTSRGYATESFARSVASRSDMTLVSGHHVAADEVDALLEALPASSYCAIVLIGHNADTDELTRRWVSRRGDIVVMLIDADNIVRLAVSNPRLPSLLDALREFVERVNAGGQARVLRIAAGSADTGDTGAEQPEPSTQDQPPPDQPPPADEPPPQGPPDRPLLRAAIAWVHQLLRDAVERVPDANGDVNGLSVTKKTLLDAFDANADRGDDDVPAALKELDDALTRALDQADRDTEPLAEAYDTFDLDGLEFRMLVLALAPELDRRFQRAIGFLLDEIPRRTGTFGLYSTLLGSTARVRGDLLFEGNLERWMVLEDSSGKPAAADESLRLDPFLVQWLLGGEDALTGDPRLRRVLRPDPWPGERLLRRHHEKTKAVDLIRWLTNYPDARGERHIDEGGEEQWLLLNGNDPEGWRALTELGSRIKDEPLLRAEPSRLAGVDIIEVEGCGFRLGRLARLTRHPLVIDVTRALDTGESDDWLRRFLAAIGRTHALAAVICTDEAHVVRQLGAMSFELRGDPPISADARIAAMREAVRAADVLVTQDIVADLASRYPLPIDGLDQASKLAQSRPRNFDADDPSLSRFTTALKEVAAEGLSHLAERIEPVFNLDNVVLPPDRHRQLVEIVDNVRFASRVLDEWKFGEQLPYGRGVTALFHGLSGTGKTMAAIGIAQRLGIQILRLDLSKVVSKYIGDTEKNIDRVFSEAERSGSALLIDEAESLLAKRSEVRDSHDRYANIEVAFLLTRMEAFGSRRPCGPAILTTNMRQALDPAFLRRLRFIIEFPRPTVEARERIWRQCLPVASHTLDDAAFRQLARRIDLTGGYIRQITLRAAFLAAAAGTLITLAHIAHATNAELAKLGMPAADLDSKQAREAA